MLETKCDKKQFLSYLILKMKNRKKKLFFSIFRKMNFFRNSFCQKYTSFKGNNNRRFQTQESLVLLDKNKLILKLVILKKVLFPYYLPDTINSHMLRL